MDAEKQAILLLAAGASRRMGQAKQLLPYEGKTMITHLLALLLRQERPLYVVLGAHRQRIKPELAPLPVRIIEHALWEAGMGTSLQLGLRSVLDHQPKIEQVLCCVVDQVGLSEAVLADFWRLALSHDLIAARYASGDYGVPALIGKSYFPAVWRLGPGQGAKPLLRRFESELAYVHFPEGDFDVDDPEDWALFLKKREEKSAEKGK
ncbi:MAG: nucleotidyltransferase family protein [Bacteroidetes bacterium]|nr:MAG: nucleotidyltransferase family protein [Bacteroidota bacterium]